MVKDDEGIDDTSAGSGQVRFNTWLGISFLPESRHCSREWKSPGSHFPLPSGLSGEDLVPVFWWSVSFCSGSCLSASGLAVNMPSTALALRPPGCVPRLLCPAD